MFSYRSDLKSDANSRGVKKFPGTQKLFPFPMSAFDDDSKEIPIKIGIVGDTETGKTSLMIKYVENKFDEDYIMTIGNSLQCIYLI